MQIDSNQAILCAYRAHQSTYTTCAFFEFDLCYLKTAYNPIRLSQDLVLFFYKSHVNLVAVRLYYSMDVPAVRTYYPRIVKRSSDLQHVFLCEMRHFK